MSGALHLNLLREEEYRTPYPVRMWILGPLLGMMLLLVVGVWWGLQYYRVRGMEGNLAQLEEAQRGLKPTHLGVLERSGVLRGIRGAVAQLELHRGGQVDFWGVLGSLPESVPATVQLTELRIPVAGEPLRDSKRPELGVTNRLEEVVMRLTGRTGGEVGEGATRGVDRLVAALQEPGYSGVLQRVEVPKGGFRQDTSVRGQSGLIFEIVCECEPRRFGK